MKEQIRHELTIKAASRALTSKANSNDRFQLINADFRQVTEIKDSSVNLIFTDPPYEGNYLAIYDDLAEYASKTLVQNGSIVTYLRQYDIPTIIRYMEGAGLTYHWLLGIKLAGPFPRAHDKGVVIKQKPLLWFTKRKRKARTYDYIADLIESSSPSERKNFTSVGTERHRSSTNNIEANFGEPNCNGSDDGKRHYWKCCAKIEAQIYWNRN